MDIGGQLLMTQAAIQSGKSYDYVLKIHTKSSLDWRQSLIEPLCGSDEQAKKAINMMNENSRIGMIGALRFKLGIDDRNKAHINQLCNRFQINNRRAFIGGTMFWFRWKVMVDFVKTRNIDLKAEHDAMEPGRCNDNGGSRLTHGWERFLGIIITSLNYEIVGITPDAPKDFDYRWYIENNPDLAKSRVRTLDDALKHWLTHGKREGRSYNAKMAQEIAKKTVPTTPITKVVETPSQQVSKVIETPDVPTVVERSTLQQAPISTETPEVLNFTESTKADISHSEVSAMIESAMVIDISKVNAKYPLILEDLDVEFYVAYYSDLQTQRIFSESEVRNHWNTIGKKEGRYPNANYARSRGEDKIPLEVLSWRWYINFYSDLPKNGVKTKNAAIEHWYTFGKREGRIPNENLYNKSNIPQ